jgi:hypothetical protein
VLKWVREKEKLEAQCAAKNCSNKLKARPIGVGTKLPAKFELRAPDRVLVARWIRSAWNGLSAATISNGYKKPYGCLLDEADVAAADLIDALAQHCAIDAKVGEVE